MNLKFKVMQNVRETLILTHIFSFFDRNLLKLVIYTETNTFPANKRNFPLRKLK